MTRERREFRGRSFDVSSLDRVMFPEVGVTKGDVLDYYARIAERMLPFIAGRPVALKRWPAGLGGESFFQKNAGSHFPDWLRRVDVPKREGGSLDHPVVDELAALPYLANQNALELHVWPAHADDLDRADLLVIDLDPPEDADVGEVRWAARAVRDLFDALGLVTCLKTSGSKGYHVLVPLEPAVSWDRVGSFAGGIAQLLARRHPHRLTDEFRKAERDGRVFIDVLRNRYGQTFVAPYSLRGLPGAPVSAPIRWDELSRVEPRGVTLSSVFRRLASLPNDPWGEAWQPQSLDQAGGRLRELLETEPRP